MGRYPRFRAAWSRAACCALTIVLSQALGASLALAQIVALGDSIVQGYGVSSSEAFPAQLEAMLHASGRNYSVSNQGISGDTTSGVLGRLDSAVPAGTRVVILFVGANDVRRQGSTVTQARDGFEEIVARLRGRNVRVINAWPYYRAARGRGMLLPDGRHLNAEGQHYLAAQLLPLVK